MRLVMQLICEACISHCCDVSVMLWELAFDVHLLLVKGMIQLGTVSSCCVVTRTCARTRAHKPWNFETLGPWNCPSQRVMMAIRLDRIVHAA